MFRKQKSLGESERSVDFWCSKVKEYYLDAESLKTVIAVPADTEAFTKQPGFPQNENAPASEIHLLILLVNLPKPIKL